jgi:hypothetical protein
MGEEKKHIISYHHLKPRAFTTDPYWDHSDHSSARVIHHQYRFHHQPSATHLLEHRSGNFPSNPTRDCFHVKRDRRTAAGRSRLAGKNIESRVLVVAVAGRDCAGDADGPVAAGRASYGPQSGVGRVCGAAGEDWPRWWRDSGTNDEQGSPGGIRLRWCGLAG